MEAIRLLKEGEGENAIAKFSLVRIKWKRLFRNNCNFGIFILEYSVYAMWYGTGEEK